MTTLAYRMMLAHNALRGGWWPVLDDWVHMSQDRSRWVSWSP